MRAVFVVLLMLLVALPATAQPRPPEAVVQRWMAAQERAARSITHVRCREESTRQLDSPKGARTIRTVADLHTRPHAPHTERDIAHVEVNGRTVPPDEQGRVLRYLRHGRSGPGRLTDALMLPAPLLRAMRPEGPPQPDPLVRGTVRVELVGAPESSADRLTLWFDARERLVQSRLLARHGPDTAPLVVDTEYRRVRGLDMPVRRRVEGTMQVRRRSRSYTLRYNQAIAYECRVSGDG